MKIEIPNYVKVVLNRLHENGYEAYIVGGCVRDTLLGKTPYDYDVCTNCLPMKMKEIFSDFDTVDSGLKHGTLTIISESKPVETTTYRSDGKYLNHRKPEQVKFESSLEQDLLRRDFTINAMCFNENDELIDMFNGQEDLKNKVIRCVGDPEKRFDEDALRIMRGLRFASVLGFEIEEKTSKAIFEKSELLKEISSERILSEMKKLLCGKNACKILLDYREVFAVIIPELKPAFDFPQNCPHHCYNVYEHICHSVENILPQPALRLTMLFHDIAKPDVVKTDENGIDHFKLHQFASAEKAKVILNRLKCDKKTSQKVFELIWEHDNRIPAQKKSVKKLMSKHDDNFFEEYLMVRRADTLAQSDYKREEKLKNLDDLKRIYDEIKEENSCLKIKDLEVNGNDIIALGLKGKEIGSALQLALDGVINEEIKNNKEEILNYIKTKRGI